MDNGRTTGRRRGGGHRTRRRWEFEYSSGRRGRWAAAWWPIGWSGHAQRRTPRRRIIRRGRRTGTRRRLMMNVMVRIRERVDMSQVPADDGSRLVGRLGTGRPPTRLMMVRDSGRLLCRLLLEVIVIIVVIVIVVVVVVVMIDAG